MTLRLKHVLAASTAGAWGSEPGPDAIAVLRSTEIDLDGTIDESSAALRSLSASERRQTSLREGDLLLVKSSGSDQHLGKVGYVDASVEGYGYSNFLQRLRLWPGHYPRFYWYLLNSSFVKSQIRLLGSTTTGLQNLSGSLIGELAIPTIPVEEQRRIAGFLDAETTRIDTIERTFRQLRQLLDERRAANVLELLCGATYARRKPGQLTWASSLPEHWDTVKLSLVTKMGSGHTPSRSRPEWWRDCTIPWITTGEVSQIRDDRREVISETRELISHIGLANSAAEIHPGGTVVLSRTASAGFSAMMGKPMATSQDFATWTCGPRLDPYYLLWCLRAMRPDLLGRLAMGSTHKTIYMPDLQSLRIPLPPLAEQREIVTKIRNSNQKTDLLIDKLGKQMELLEERRRVLIATMVSGRDAAYCSQVSQRRSA